VFDIAICLGGVLDAAPAGVVNILFLMVLFECQLL
jgi:hypothetical protein